MTDTTRHPGTATAARPAAPATLDLEVWVWRGTIAESRHRLQAVAVDDDGAVLAATAAPDLVTSLRSAAKPFQLLPLVERGHADRWGFSEEELAVMAASHAGTDRHLALVRGILARIGLVESDLACGFHEPFDEAAAKSLRGRPDDRSPLYNNCSGKHAGMLALALAEGWPTTGYEKAAHPVQKLMLATVAEICGLPAAEVAVAVDGCNACVFGVPLRAMALGYARFAAAAAIGDARARALARIRAAMIAHPWATGGAGRLSTELMERTGGRLVSKGGAEGLECIGVPERRLGLAIKCEDGQARGLAPAAIALLERLGVLGEVEGARLLSLRRPVVRNYVGLEVGTLEVRLTGAGPRAGAILPVANSAANPGRAQEPPTR